TSHLLGRNPPLSTRLGTSVRGRTGPHLYSFHSLVRVKCKPRSTWGCATEYAAISGNQGQGTMMLPEFTTPFSKPAIEASFSECDMPKSSAWMISNLAVRG